MLASVCSTTISFFIQLFPEWDGCQSFSNFEKSTSRRTRQIRRISARMYKKPPREHNCFRSFSEHHWDAYQLMQNHPCSRIDYRDPMKSEGLSSKDVARLQEASLQNLPAIKCCFRCHHHSVKILHSLFWASSTGPCANFYWKRKTELQTLFAI